MERCLGDDQQVGITLASLPFSRIIVLTALLAAAQALFPDSMFETSRDLPGWSVPGEWNGTFTLVNDAAGSDHVVEWDDGRTAAYELLLRTPWPVYGEFAYAGYTDRSNPSEPGMVSRIDEMHFILGSVMEGNLWGGRSRVLAGLGGMFFGDFLGSRAQIRLHDTLGNPRPIPPRDSYSSPESALVLSTEAGITAPGGAPFTLSLSFLANTRRLVEMDASLGLLLESPFGASRISAVYRAIEPGYSPPAVTAYLEDSRGFWVEYGFRVHALSVDYSLSPGGGLSQGSLGFSFSGSSRSTPGARWKGGYLVDFALGLGTVGFVNRISWSPSSWTAGSSVFSLVVDLHSSNVRDSEPYSRFQKTLAGIEWSRPLYPGRDIVLEPYAGLSAGGSYRKDYNPTDTVYTATLASEESMVIGRINLGLRFTPFSSIRSGRRLGYGLVAGAAFDAEFPSTDPLSGVFFIGLSFSDRPAVFP